MVLSFWEKFPFPWKSLDKQNFKKLIYVYDPGIFFSMDLKKNYIEIGVEQYLFTLLK